jgi:hypothetical protein
MIILDYSDQYSGTIKMTLQYSKLIGDMEFGDYPGNFTAYKVSDVPERTPAAWSSFPEDDYDFENREM